MMLFLLDQFACELQRSADVLNAQIIFPLDILEAHTASQAANDNCHGSSRAANHRFAVANLRINYDTFIHR